MNRYLEKLAGLGNTVGRFTNLSANRGVRAEGHLAGAGLIEKVRRGSMLQGKKFGLTGPVRNKGLTIAKNKSSTNLDGATGMASGLQQSFRK